MLAALFFATAAHPAHNVKLKPGAKGRQCLKCHEAFQKKMKQRSIHPLMKSGECTGCHDPHTSSHKNLLISDVTTLCVGCHQKMVPDKARSSHKVVVEGNCITCHNSHGSDNRFILSKSGNELCIECHNDIGSPENKVRFRHAPLEKDRGCLSCHSPHASTRADHLLKTGVPSLCSECHKTGHATFRGRHMNYNVTDSRCDSCHNPHGSNKKGLLYDEVHEPVAEKKCNACHTAPTASKALKTKKQGRQLCQDCHNDMIKATFNKNRVHWPLADSVGCLNCHNPHGTKEKKLLNDTQFNVCGKCHADTVKLQQWSIENPKNKNLCEPVKKGNCASCHTPHAADNILLMAQKNVSIDLCGKCHEWQAHATHPIGEKAVDQRNRNLTVECLSCHVGCGTGNKPWMMPFETTYDLCTQCHVERRR
jgi:DmsE family decaheme c-type cytochrome